MPRLHKSHKAIALWRYQQIQEPLAIHSRDVRGEILRQISKTPVLWPSGITRKISLATLYRWINLFLADGLKALQPVQRKDTGKHKARLPVDVIQKARELLIADPDISFGFLLPVLRADPQLNLDGRRIRISRSTLHRRLASDPSYRHFKRARKKQRQRIRYLGRHVHDIWRLDAKGPVYIRLISGTSLCFHVLTVLEDVSRAVLAAIIALTPNLRAAVRTFRIAALRWGLPERFYADRASIFDSEPFRAGLAQLGVNRVFVQSRNPEANGKIEAYHRSLATWFTKRLPRQQVIDIEHLQQLLDAFVEVLYQDHHHRGLHNTPRNELADRISKRRVPPAVLEMAFRQERLLKSHPKTGEIDLPSGTFLVPEHLRGQKLIFLLDPEPHLPPLVVEPGTSHHLPIKRAAIRLGDCTQETPHHTRWGEGPLQILYDSWQGKIRPVAEPGFGLPEIFKLLEQTTGRPVPNSDEETARIQRAWADLGPLPREATFAAFDSIRRALGDGRPLSAYLDALAEKIHPTTHKNPGKYRRKFP